MVKMNNRMANSIEPDQTTRDEPSYLDLYCLQNYAKVSVLVCRNESVNSDS